MPVKRKAGKARIGAMPELEWMILTDQVDPFTVEGWEGYFVRYHQAPWCLAAPSLGDYWLAHGDAITADWIEESPGTRPSFWWKFSAPRWIDFDAVMAEPRRRLGGTGTANAHRSDGKRLDLIAWRLGLPVLSEWRGLDWSDPPTFESQAAYLKRHGLFLPSEERRLTKAAFVPETIALPD